jgi:hypothetical protein
MRTAEVSGMCATVRNMRCILEWSSEESFRLLTGEGISASRRWNCCGSLDPVRAGGARSNSNARLLWSLLLTRRCWPRWCHGRCGVFGEERKTEALKRSRRNSTWCEITTAMDPPGASAAAVKYVGWRRGDKGKGGKGK